MITIFCCLDLTYCRCILDVFNNSILKVFGACSTCCHQLDRLVVIMYMCIYFGSTSFGLDIDMHTSSEDTHNENV